MASPDDRRYTQTHEWHKPEGDTVTVGLTRFAIDELTDVTYVDITKQDGGISAGEVFGEIESVKATSEMYSGIDGVVVAVNQEAVDNPQIINQDPFGRGWLIKIQASDLKQLDALIGATEYDQNHAT